MLLGLVNGIIVFGKGSHSELYLVKGYHYTCCIYRMDCMPIYVKFFGKGFILDLSTHDHPMVMLSSAQSALHNSIGYNLYDKKSIHVHWMPHPLRECRVEWAAVGLDGLC